MDFDDGSTVFDGPETTRMSRSRYSRLGSLMKTRYDVKKIILDIKKEAPTVMMTISFGIMVPGNQLPKQIGSTSMSQVIQDAMQIRKPITFKILDFLNRCLNP